MKFYIENIRNKQTHITHVQQCCKEETTSDYLRFSKYNSRKVLASDRCTKAAGPNKLASSRTF
jgi:hypothetical protein